MREIVLDTETTGFDPVTGDRIVEIGAIELLNHLPTGRTYHQYINPERSMPAEAFAVHGLGDEFLADKPRFAEIAQDFRDFIGMDSRLVIHNASFDMKFLNFELKKAGHPEIAAPRALDTLMLARDRFPGSPATLDALCRRFGIDNSNRTLHGALLDSELLAEVYLELIGGRQPDLVLDQPQEKTETQTVQTGPMTPRQPRPAPLPPRLTEAEAEAHAGFIAKIGEAAIWNRYS
ncbi:MAG: DNA polymerase III subunit epsilon [Paracoccus sp. (in: a-proteobacteria)]|uniref:DNA polymerase III subunit epsilon n=1 Tax=Paracoccus sp. TaxID=267 RepID=UPI0026E0E079|nr:DNA polymerase III subunit epsilon [Paracoccus sp. (in: a-proteobacteria)]MDO5621639.1 DNA polymerase III subunit epsilon [Paracoccus sp. (in: a-proteobacteria)]